MYSLTGEHPQPTAVWEYGRPMHSVSLWGMMAVLVAQTVLLLTPPLFPVQSMANNYGVFAAAVPPVLNVVDFAHRLVGPKPLEYLSGAMNKMSNHLVPTWNPYMPRVRAPAAPM